MFSGQEVVSQEECRLVLGKFYEGINCIDYNTPDSGPVLSMTLTDAETASYNPVTQTLTTINFSVRPLILDSNTNFTYLFMAELPSNATGLEVIMFAEKYTKIRIMPLYLVRTCDTYHWGWDVPDTTIPDPYKWSYLRSICYNQDETIIVFSGEVDELTQYEITLAGNEFIKDTTVRLYFHDAAVPLVDYTITTEVEEIEVIDPATKEVIDIIKTTITTMKLPIEADTARVKGAYSTTILIRPCNFLNVPGVFGSFQYCFDETTQLIKVGFYTQQMTLDLVPDEDGWVYVDNSRLRVVSQ